jgi:ElaB/YqjD/DUF883 family membrane-anchored ribosome-binding protein
MELMAGKLLEKNMVERKEHSDEVKELEDEVERLEEEVENRYAGPGEYIRDKAKNFTSKFEDLIPE